MKKRGVCTKVQIDKQRSSLQKLKREIQNVLKEDCIRHIDSSKHKNLKIVMEKRDAARDTKKYTTSKKTHEERCKGIKRRQREVRMLLVMGDATKGSPKSIIKHRHEDAGKTK